MVKSDDLLSGKTVWVFVVAAVLILFNQFQLFQINSILNPSTGTISRDFVTLANADLSSVDINNIKSTAQSVAATIDLSEAKDAQGVINAMIPKGTPEYGAKLGISYDDPLTALNFLAYKLYPAIKQDVQTNSPDVWQRYLNLASKPVGISCEFCCGVGPVGITVKGDLACGCAHNPAIQAITLFLMKNAEMSDAEVLREVMRWKALWFPKNMVEIGLKIAGGDASVLNDVPSMVGGC